MGKVHDAAIANVNGPSITPEGPLLAELGWLLNEVVEAVQANRCAGDRYDHTGRSADDGANDESGTTNDHHRNVLSGTNVSVGGGRQRRALCGFNTNSNPVRCDRRAPSRLLWTQRFWRLRDSDGRVWSNRERSSGCERNDLSRQRVSPLRFGVEIKRVRRVLADDENSEPAARADKLVGNTWAIPAGLALRHDNTDIWIRGLLRMRAPSRHARGSLDDESRG